MTTRRLTLEPLQVEHADEMVPVLASAALYEFTGGAPPDIAGLAKRYRSQVAGSGDPGEEWRNWIIRSISGGEAVGFVQADIVDAEAELAWLVGVEHQYQGFAAEAARAMMTELEGLGIRRFTAHIHPEHLASQRVAAAVGLARAGHVDDDGEEIWANPTSEE